MTAPDWNRRTRCRAEPVGPADAPSTATASPAGSRAVPTDGEHPPIATDGGRDGDRPPVPREDREPTKAERFHEQSGSFEDVGKAIAILVILGILAYVVLVVL